MQAGAAAPGLQARSQSAYKPAMISSADADAVVIGAGFFGCHVALRLRALGMARVILVDRSTGLLRRASYVNQARVHNGYHYPRSLGTAARSHRNFVRFCTDHPFAIADGFEKIYAIARQSHVSPSQFVAFCGEIGAPCRESAAHLRALFDPDLIDAAFLTREVAFDAVALAKDLLSRLHAAGVELRLATPARLQGADATGATVALGTGTLRARYVFNCTYAGLDAVGIRLRNVLKKELTEIALIEPAPVFANVGVTVMDGPFFSTMPFPARGCHSLSHVRYTPHAAWIEPADAMTSTQTHVTAMLRDGARYMPPLARARPLGSLFDIKVVLLSTEQDDARPILFEPSAESGRVISILGGKIDNIYDVLDVLERHDWS
jgi:glycine/D-amino acid oxidase-like deaminating enzyme